MRESSTPFAAAVVAAPMQKLCPAYNGLSIPAWSRIERNLSVNSHLLGGNGLRTETEALGYSHGLQDNLVRRIQGTITVQFFQCIRPHRYGKGLSLKL